MAWTASTALRNAWLDKIDDLLNAGGGAGKWRIYDGVTLLAEGTLSATALQAASAGTITFNTINSDASANASGTPATVELLDFADVLVLDGTAGSGSGNDAVLDEETITILDVVPWTASASTFTAGNP